jgi:hypothetical protein
MFFIGMTSDMQDVCDQVHMLPCYLSDMLSPAFNSRGDALQAIQDIGRDALVFMFKTLKGYK